MVEGGRGAVERVFHFHLGVVMFGDRSSRKLWENKVNRDFDEIRKGRAEIKDLMAEGYFGGWDDAVSEIDRNIQSMLDDEYPYHDDDEYPCHDG